jgi:hypothetical protein
MDPGEMTPAEQAVAETAAGMDALTNGTGPEPSIAGEATQSPPKGPQPSGVPVTLEELQRLVGATTRDVGGMISRLDQLETTVRRTDRQVLMMIGMVSILVWAVKGLAARIPEEVADAAASD